MYIDDIDINIVNTMALQIANPTVVDKVALLAKAMGLSKTAAVEKAVDRMLSEALAVQPESSRQMSALVAQFDLVPDRPDAHDPLLWDDLGLPR